MSLPNPYEAPRHLDRPRPGPRRKPSSFGCVFSLLGGIGGAVFGASRPFVMYGAGARGFPIVCGFLGAVLAAVVGHFIGLTVSGPTSIADPDETEAEARRRKVLDEIAVAEDLLSRAEQEGDEDVRGKLVEYRAKLERKLRG